MTTLEQEILKSLNKLETAVQSLRNGGAKPDLISIFAEIDGLTNQLPRDADPSLLHFLHKKSYEKARLWLEGRKSDISRGNCLKD